MEYKEEYIIRKATTEVVGSVNYRIEYTVQETVSGVIEEVNVSFYSVKTVEEKEELKRLGNAYYNSSRSYLSFDLSMAVADQAIVAAQYYTDLQTILN